MTSTTPAFKQSMFRLLQTGWWVLFIPSLMFGLANIAYAFRTVLTTNAPPLDAAHFDAFVEHYRTLNNAFLIVLSFSVAAYVFWKRRNDWLSIIVSIGLFTLSISDILNTRPILADYPELNALYVVINLVNRLCVLVMLLILPNGRFEPRWTRWLAFLWFVLISIWFLFPGSPVDLYGKFFVPFPPRRLIWVTTGVAVMIYRYRNIFTPEERQQSKWLLLGWLIGLVNLLVVVFSEAVISRFENLPAGFLEMLFIFDMLLLVVATVVTPLAMGMFLLRVSLWEVDYVTNRTLALGAVIHTGGAILFSMYIVSFRALERLTEFDPRWPATAITFGIVLLLVRPLSNLWIDLVDRYLYGIRINYRHHSATMSKAIHAPDEHPTTLQGYGHLEYLGEGGMSEIYRAFHPRLRKNVAIKILRTELQQDERIVQRLEREATILRQLDHPGIIKLIDAQIGEEKAYLVMEFIEGQNLHEYARAAKPMPQADVRAIVCALAEALDHLHQHRIVHRDVKPSNVMVEQVNLRVVLMDFGLAVAGFGSTEGILTGTGIVGTVNYMAPEQIRRKPYLDGRCDIYSLGVLAYYLLTGRLPFKHENVGATLIAHLMHPVPDPSEVNPAITPQMVKALRRAMAKEPEERYASAALFAEDLFSLTVAA